jgi:hypothetical protein
VQLLAVTEWVVGLMSGVLGTLAVVIAVTGTLPSWLTRTRAAEFTRGEVRALGAGWAVVWAGTAIYGLAGVIILPTPNVWWISNIAALVFVTYVVALQVAIALHHYGYWPFRRRQVPNT